MIDYLIETAISNSIFAILLAIIALAVTVRANRPQLAYLFWLVVFLKLITPPVVNVPIAIAASEANLMDSALESPIFGDDILVSPKPVDVESLPDSESLKQGFSNSAIQHYLKPTALAIWFTGCLVLLAASFQRVTTFNRLLKIRATKPSSQLQTKIRDLADRMQIPHSPQVMFIDAKISPMVWWTGGQVQIVLPNWLTLELSEKDWENVVAHELAHVKRKDYLTRWLEWSVCTIFWWNPIAWWAQRNLRAVEEICCDSLVLQQLNPQPQAYANSILQAVESLVCPEIRPPVMASQINSGGFLERRFEMILSGNLSPKRSLASQFLAVMTIVLLVPLGLVRAQDIEKIERKLDRMVENGKLEPEHAEVMLEALIELLEEQEQEENEWHEREEDEHDDDEPHERHNNWVDREEIIRNIERHVHATTREIQEAMERGKLSEKEGRRKLEEIRHGAHEKMQRMKEELHELQRHDHERDHQRIEHERERHLRNQERYGPERERYEHRHEHENEWHDRRRHDHERARPVRERERHDRDLATIELELHRLDEERRSLEQQRAILEREYERHDRSLHQQRENVLQRMIEELRIADEHGRRGDQEAAKIIEQQANRADIAALRRKIKQAVESGKMSIEDAEKKLQAIVKEQLIFNESRHGEQADNDEEMRQIGKELRIAVKNGKLTKEEAREKMEGFLKERRHRKNHGHSEDRVDRRLEEMLLFLAENMKQPDLAGKIKEKIAKNSGSIESKLRAIHFVEQLLHKAELQEEKLHVIETEIREAVENGKLSPREAKEKMEYLIKEMTIERYKGDHDREHHEHDDDHHEHDDDHDGHDDDHDGHDDEHALK